MERMKRWNGSAWVYLEPKAWTGSAWVQTQAKEWNGFSWITSSVEPIADYYNADTTGGCHNDGVTDDLAHLQASATAAKAAGKTLYLPAGGGYKLSGTWNLPTNLTIKGDGDGSHVLGKIGMNTGCDVTDLFIGVSTGTGLGFAAATLLTDMNFTRCRFRGGQSGAVVQETSATQHFNGLTFSDCRFEVAYFNAFTALGHSVSLQTDRGMSAGQLMDNLTFDHCHFGIPNQYGQTENKYGSILFYSHGNDTMTSTNYCDNLTVTNCIFEKSWNWAIDYAMNSTASTRVYPLDYCKFTCTGNLFKGQGGHRAEAYEDYCIALDLEPVYNALIEDNVFWRCEYDSVRLTWGSRYSVVQNNIFDYRVENGISPAVYTNPTTGSRYNYWNFRVLNLSSGDHLQALNNTYYLPTDFDDSYYGTPTDNGSWIGKDASTLTVTGNKVYINDSTPPDYETTMDVGPRPA